MVILLFIDCKGIAYTEGNHNSNKVNGNINKIHIKSKDTEICVKKYYDTGNSAYYSSGFSTEKGI